MQETIAMRPRTKKNSKIKNEVVEYEPHEIRIFHNDVTDFVFLLT